MSFNLIYITPYNAQGIRAEQVQSRQTYQALAEAHSSVMGIFPKDKDDSSVVSDAQYIYIPRLPRVRRIIGPRLTRYILKATFALQAYFRYVRFAPFPRIIYCRDFAIAFVFNLLKRFGLVNGVIFEIHGLPDQMSDIFQNRHEEILITPIIRSALRRSDALAPTTHAMKHLIQDHYKHPDRIQVMPNAHKIESVNGYQRHLEPSPSPFKVGYAGLVYERHGITTLLDAVEYLDDGIQVLLAGGQEGEIDRLRERYSHCFKTGRIEHAGRLPHNAMGHFYKQLHIGVHLLQNDIDGRLFRNSLKVFEYMAMGLPIVAVDLPSTREILNETNAVFFTADDPVSLANTINNLYHNPQLRQALSRQALHDSENYTYSRKAQRILDLAAQLILAE